MFTCLPLAYNISFDPSPLGENISGTNIGSVITQTWAVAESKQGPAFLIVNVASKWGLTMRNYEEIQSLHNRYRKKGLIILAFPCNDFHNQEPATNHDVISILLPIYVFSYINKHVYIYLFLFLFNRSLSLQKKR